MSGVDRRGFLRGSAAAAAAGAGLAAGAAGGAAAKQATPAFDGPQQAGILDPPQSRATFVALDCTAADRIELQIALRTLSAKARELVRGGLTRLLEYDSPPYDSGVAGPDVAPGGLTVTIGLGAAIFDGRYDLAGVRPRHLHALPVFGDDELDPAFTHGDVLVQIGADQPDTVVHALRELLRATRGAFVVRWMIDGFTSPDRGPKPAGARRNLLGFRDGTANPDPADDTLMRRLTWVGRGGGEPAWTAGGTYAVVRIIRMQVEFWDRIGLREQEALIGRRRESGAPLGGRGERQDPRYDLDPKGMRIPLDAHIRLANPRTPATAGQRFLRRGFNYHRGIDAAGDLDQGLIFVAFNQDPVRQFETVQRRLDGEPLSDYISPIGGGLFFLPRGAGGSADFVGSGAFRA